MNLTLTKSSIYSIKNQTFPVFDFDQTWIFLLFLFSLLGIILTIIMCFCLIYYSIRRINDHFYLLYFFLCLSICFLYVIVIFFLVRGNEIVCGLREFLSQFAYVLLFSTLLTRYIMQWLSTRILSQRTKQLTTLLIYLLLIFTQIPIGILWWYFTIPRYCSQKSYQQMPKYRFHFSKRLPTKHSCSYQCIVDYRFYATYIYVIIQLIICTILSICLFIYRYCHRNQHEKKTNQIYQICHSTLNMCALILIDFVWLIWTMSYYFTHTIFVFPSLIIGMFMIATISLLLILFPQIYFYSKNPSKKLSFTKGSLFSNKLVSIDDMKDRDLLIENKSLDERKHSKKTNSSDTSYEIGMSGTFLPITRTPKGLCKSSEDKIDQNNEIRTDTLKQPLQRQLTSSSLISDFVNPNYRTDYYYRDETLIPILCSSQKRQASTPVQMRVLVKSPSSSVPTARRIYSGADHRYVVHPNSRYHLSPPPPPPPPATPSMQQQHFLVDPYRTMPSHSSSTIWRSSLPASYRQPYPCRQFYVDNRSLSQRLWDIDSGDDLDDLEENHSVKDYFHRPYHYSDQTLSNIDNLEEQEDESPNRKLVFI